MQSLRPQGPKLMRISLLPILALTLSCSDEPHKQFVALGERIALPAKLWVDLPAPEALLTTAYHHQVCFLPTAPARRADDPMGIVDSAGRQIVVWAAASGPDGEIMLPLMSYAEERICFGVSDSGLERRFASIRLQASAPLKIERVEWQSTDK